MDLDHFRNAENISLYIFLGDTKHLRIVFESSIHEKNFEFELKKSNAYRLSITAEIRYLEGESNSPHFSTFLLGLPASDRYKLIERQLALPFLAKFFALASFRKEFDALGIFLI